jgi:hypothetical protein
MAHLWGANLSESIVIGRYRYKAGLLMLNLFLELEDSILTMAPIILAMVQMCIEVMTTDLLIQV